MTDLHKSLAEKNIGFAQQIQSDYGKWVLASLLTANGGALLALIQLKPDPETLILSGTWFFVGIALTLASGGLTWLNFTAATLMYLHVLQDSPSGVNRAERTAVAAGRMAILSTIAATISFCYGGWSAAHVLSKPESCMGLPADMVGGACRLLDALFTR